MVLRIISLLVYIALLYNPYAFAQDCSKSKAYRQCTYPEDSRFENKLNWSKSFKKGQTKQYVLTFNKGYLYYISVCSKDLGVNIHIKLREDNELQDILYDNAINELSGIIELDMKETKKMIVEISVPPNKINESKKIYTCIGVRMFYRKRK